MNSDKLRYWANLIYIDKTVGTRGGASKHQRKILEIWNLIQQAKDNPTVEVYESIKNYQPVHCPESEITQIYYLAYLQYCVNNIDGIVQKNGGKKE